MKLSHYNRNFNYLYCEDDQPEIRDVGDRTSNLKKKNMFKHLKKKYKFIYL